MKDNNIDGEKNILNEKDPCINHVENLKYYKIPMEERNEE